MMRNKFAQNCYVCGKLVEVGKGHFQRDLGNWLVKHDGCSKGDIKTPKDLMHERRKDKWAKSEIKINQE